MVHFFAIMLWVAGVLAFVAGMPQLGCRDLRRRRRQRRVRLRAGAPGRTRRRTVARPAPSPRHRCSATGCPWRSTPRSWWSATSCCSQAGDRVSADLRVDRRARAAHRHVAAHRRERPRSPADRGDQCYAGTFVVEGEGRAVVAAIGASTRLAAIAALTQSGRRPRQPARARARPGGADRRGHRGRASGVAVLRGGARRSARRPRTASCSRSA